MTTSRIMQTVLVALLPGLAAMTYAWGAGVLWNLMILSASCVAIEAFVLKLRAKDLRNISLELQDCTALLTGWLIAICLPPHMPFGLLLLAAVAAVGLAKHAYGGLGRNVFNPAMVGYAVLLVSFPESLANWPTATDKSVDALSGATLLTEFRYREGLTVSEFNNLFDASFRQQEIISLSFFAGALLLLYQKLLAWRIPAAMFAAVGVCSLFGYDQGSSHSAGSAVFHWISGGFVAAAFFIATDPVTHPRQPRQQLVFGVIIGTLIYVIRGYGSFPDGIAFAVLLANCCTPLLNRFASKNLQAPVLDVERG